MAGTIRLSTIRLGNKQVRYIYLHQQSYFYVTARTRIEDVPLFLGADVLCGSNVLTKNHGRVHARYARDKLATKIKLRDVQVEGTNHSSQLWFYNVQGLFKIAFEYLQEETQRDCLIHLKDLWLETLEWAQLEQEMSLRYYNDQQVMELTQEVSETSQIVTCTMDGQEHVIACYPSGNIQIEGSSNIIPIDESVEEVVVIEPPNTVENPVPVATSDTVDQSVVLLDGIVTTSPAKLGNDSPPQNLDGVPIRTHMTVDQIHSHVAAFIQAQIDSKSDSDKEVLKQFQLMIHLFEADFIDNDSKNEGFPLDVIRSYTSLLQNDIQQDAYSEPVFPVSKRSNLALCIICEWLGKKLHSFSKDISKRVELFKLSHIDSINSLPSAKSLVKNLFPVCMKMLILSWMGQKGLDCDQGSDASSECNSSPPSKKHMVTEQQSKDSMTDSFPFVQLILEFANNVLISGVAHVLYSRLLHDGTC